ncbi:MAG: methionine--tRNA ligase subunit beta, partial [Candidatus Hodarchaeota archaeon]
TWQDFEQRINTDLNDVIGNYIHRIFVLLHKFCDGKLPECHRLDDTDRDFVNKINEIPDTIADYFDQFEFKKALAAVVDFARSSNIYLSTKEPWKLIDTNSSAVETTLFLCAQSVSTLAILLSPIIPEACERIWKTLGQEGSVGEQSLSEAGKLRLLPNLQIKKPKPFFSKINTEELKAKLLELRTQKKSISPEEVKMTNDEQKFISLEEFQKLDIRIGTIISVEQIPKAKRLLKLKVDLGSEIGERQLVAGLAQYRKIEELVGKRITVIVNLEPATIRGVKSEGMLLAATEGETLGLLVPDQEVANGLRVS